MSASLPKISKWLPLSVSHTAVAHSDRQCAAIAGLPAHPGRYLLLPQHATPSGLKLHGVQVHSKENKVSALGPAVTCGQLFIIAALQTLRQRHHNLMQHYKPPQAIKTATC